MSMRKLGALLVTVLFLASFSPLVFAATEDELHISFDPDGDVDIDVNISEYNFTSALAGTWTNTTGSTFTIYNNGTINMDVQIKTNASTDQTDMDLNASGVAPAQDEYAINITGLDLTPATGNTFLTTAYADEFENNIAASGGTATFDICLLVGDLSVNHTLQNTTIYFQGSITN